MFTKMLKLAMTLTACFSIVQSIFAEIDPDLVPGTYISDVVGQPIFDSSGNQVGSSALGRMTALLPGGIAFFSQTEFDTIANKFPDPLSTIKSGLVEDNQQQPNFGTWVIDGDRIRVMTFEFYFLSTTAEFDNMFFKGVNRNTWLFQVDTDSDNIGANGYKDLKLIASTLVEVDPPRNPLNPNAKATSSFRRAFTKNNPLIFHRAPNFNNDLKNVN